jgi:hypothetical protein
MLGKLRSSVCFQIPVGYQDETGFHLGACADYGDGASAGSLNQRLRDW